MDSHSSPPTLLFIAKGLSGSCDQLDIVSEVVNLLHGNGDLYERGDHGRLPIHEAALSNKAIFLDVVWYHLSQNSSDNDDSDRIQDYFQEVDDQGRNLLHLACVSSAVSVVDWLIHHDFSFTEPRDIFGNAPIDILINRGNKNLFSLLIGSIEHALSEDFNHQILHVLTHRDSRSGRSASRACFHEGILSSGLEKLIFFQVGIQLANLEAVYSLVSTRLILEEAYTKSDNDASYNSTLLDKIMINFRVIRRHPLMTLQFCVLWPLARLISNFYPLLWPVLSSWAWIYYTFSILPLLAKFSMGKTTEEEISQDFSDLESENGPDSFFTPRMVLLFHCTNILFLSTSSITSYFLLRLQQKQKEDKLVHSPFSTELPSPPVEISSYGSTISSSNSLPFASVFRWQSFHRSIALRSAYRQLITTGTLPPLLPPQFPISTSASLFRPNKGRETVSSQLETPLTSPSASDSDERTRHSYERFGVLAKISRYLDRPYYPLPSHLYRGCASCGVMKPPDTEHCNSCRSCVCLRDHHCVWTSGCIGGSAHPQFMLFVFFGTLNCISWLILLWMLVSVHTPTFEEARLINNPSILQTVEGAILAGSRLLVNLVGFSKNLSPSASESSVSNNQGAKNIIVNSLYGKLKRGLPSPLPDALLTTATVDSVVSSIVDASLSELVPRRRSFFSSFMVHFTNAPLWWILALLPIPITIFGIALLIFHSALVCTSRTTSQLLKGKKPFSVRLGNANPSFVSGSGSGSVNSEAPSWSGFSQVFVYIKNWLQFWRFADIFPTFEEFVALPIWSFLPFSDAVLRFLLSCNKYVRQKLFPWSIRYLTEQEAVNLLPGVKDSLQYIRDNHTKRQMQSSSEYDHPPDGSFSSAHHGNASVNSSHIGGRRRSVWQTQTTSTGRHTYASYKRGTSAASYGGKATASGSKDPETGETDIASSTGTSSVVEISANTLISPSATLHPNHTSDVATFLSSLLNLPSTNQSQMSVVISSDFDSRNVNNSTEMKPLGHHSQFHSLSAVSEADEKSSTSDQLEILKSRIQEPEDLGYSDLLSPKISSSSPTSMNSGEDLF